MKNHFIREEYVYENVKKSSRDRESSETDEKVKSHKNRLQIQTNKRSNLHIIYYNCNKRSFADSKT